MQRRRLWLFRIAALLFPVLALAVLEFVLWLVEGPGPKDPRLNISPLSTFYRRNENGQEYYYIAQKYILNAGTIKFPVKKPADTIRIFVLGESAAAGWPHPPQETFSAYLEHALEVARPGKRIEVINASAHGFAAYRIRYILHEVLRMEADAVILWTGNNEFMEERNYDTASSWLAAVGHHLRTVGLLRSVCGFDHRAQLDGGDLNGVADAFWRKVKQQALHLRENPEQFAQVKLHYAESLQAMAEDAAEHGVPLILFTVPVNLRDWLPTVSHHSLEGADLSKWQECYDAGRRRLFQKAGDTDGVAAMQKATELEPDHAESHFWLGRLQEAAGQRSEALASYHRAVDLDYTPFRAISAFNDSVRQTARGNANATLLDLDTIFATESDRGAPGFDLFLDNVHPTNRGNLIVARHAFALLCRLLPGPFEATTFAPPATKPGEPAYEDFNDLSVVKAAFNMAAVNHQYDRAISALQAMSRCEFQQPIKGPQDAVLDRFHPHFARGYRAFTAYQELQRRIMLGEAVSDSERQRVRQALDEYYDAEYPYGKF